MCDLLLLVCLAVGPGAVAPPCDADIVLINDTGCGSPCCAQEPAGSGHYVFNHAAVEQIDIRGNSDAVQSVSFPNLVFVEKRIRISYNGAGAVTRISFPSLRSAGAIEIVGNPGLLEIDLPRLQYVENEDWDAYLKVQSNAELVSLHAPMLARISAPEAGSASLQLRYNHALPLIDFPNLRTLEVGADDGEAYIFIQGNDQTQEVRMDQLVRLVAGESYISYLIVDDMPSLTGISFPRLDALLPAGDPSNFSELTIGHSPLLTEFSFPALRRVSLLQLSSLKGTRRAMFPSLTELDYLWIFRGCAGPESSMKLYICSLDPVDMLLGNDDGLCGPEGYLLYAADPENAAACDASPVCTTFEPDPGECKCGVPGSCTATP